MKIERFYTGPVNVNTYVVIDEESKEACLVDPGGDSKELIAYLRDERIDVKFILLTHGHCDHIGGVKVFSNLFKAPVYAHADEAPILMDPEENFSPQVFGSKFKYRPDVFFNEETKSLFIGEKNVKILHTPGHSPGGTCFLIDDTLISGDTLFDGSIGRTDFPHSDGQQLLTSIRTKLLTLDDNTKVYPGHGGFTTIGREKKMNPFL